MLFRSSSFGKNCLVNGQWNYDWQYLSVNGDNKVFMNDVVPGVDKIMDFRENGLKYNYLVRTPQHLTTQNFEISEEYVLPAGYKLRRDNSEGREENNGWTGNFEVVSPQGTVEGVIYAPLIFDANKQWTLGTYQLETNGERPLSNWLFRIRG